MGNNYDDQDDYWWEVEQGLIEPTGEPKATGIGKILGGAFIMYLAFASILGFLGVEIGEVLALVLFIFGVIIAKVLR